MLSISVKVYKIVYLYLYPTFTEFHIQIPHLCLDTIDVKLGIRDIHCQELKPKSKSL